MAEKKRTGLNILEIIGRDTPLITDISKYEKKLSEEIQRSSFLILGGAGSIGQAVTKEIFKRNPKKIHVVDISENNLVELVRDIRSSFGYIKGEFRTFALDIGALEFEAYFEHQDAFDYVLNLSALKHVRSEKDPFTLMRMIDVNILNTIKTLEMCIDSSVKKYFCVSTDKAANPANMMGASKRIMEMFLLYYGKFLPISTARFANVAFSDGSLLHGFRQRILKEQPIAAPNDVRRYFITSQEAGELCLMATIFGENGDILFPKLNEKLHLATFSDIAIRYLQQLSYEPLLCASEQEARSKVDQAKQMQAWPCYFSESDTTGEKEYEEFYLTEEEVDAEKFQSLGIVKNAARISGERLATFQNDIEKLRFGGNWTRREIIELFRTLLPAFNHYETGKFLDGKM
jgi:UDP-N-acetylglucosamine 4,6-dehydratase